jgi:hypothetical protein
VDGKDGILSVVGAAHEELKLAAIHLCGKGMEFTFHILSQEGVLVPFSQGGQFAKVLDLAGQGAPPLDVLL